MSAPLLYDHQNRPIPLGSLIGTGGEGKVFTAGSSSDLVAKVYSSSSVQRDEKLRVMVAMASQELVNYAAWPSATLHEKPGGPTVGFLMRRIKDHQEIHSVYSPAHRKTMFPQADWKFLVHTAMNC